MQKFSITATGSKLIDIPPGRTVHIAASGTYTATIEVKYSTAAGTFVSFATPKTLSSPTEISVVNVGATNQMQVNCSAYTSGTAVIIANPDALQERGR